MVHLQEVRLAALPLERFESILGKEQMRAALDRAASIRELLGPNVLWNVSSTAVGGGVAEMLRPLLSYTRGAGIDTRWVVIAGDEPFFRVTKRLHHALHGSPGDGSSLGDEARAIYEQTLRRNAVELASRVRPGDVALLHDPQTAGLAPSLMEGGAHVIWRCHIGQDVTNDEVERGWSFLFPYLKEVRSLVFSRDAYVPAYCDGGKSTIIRPSIDAFSPKNQEIDEATVHSILVHVGLVEGPPPEANPVFTRADGTPGRVERHADFVRQGRAPTWETPLVVQVSRWDPLKDPIGVMRGFAEILDGAAPGNAELVLAGPNVHAVADDPEGAETLDAVEAAWRELPNAVRDRVHVASLPSEDAEENAAIVNALQRHAAVVVQKSLHEGFGLTVTEAMWKSRPVLASAVGGIQDQIEPGVSGELLDDPTDLGSFAAALRRLLEDRPYAEGLGSAAHERVRQKYLGPRHLLQYALVIERILS